MSRPTRIPVLRLAGLCAAFVPLVQAAPAPAATDAGIARDAVAVVHAVGEASQRLDIDAALKDVWGDPRALLVVSEGHPMPVAEFREEMRGFYASMAAMKFTTLGEEVRVLGSDLVLDAWTYRVEGAAKSGGRFVIETETATFLVRRIGGAWKIIFFQEAASPMQRLPAEGGAAPPQ